MDKALWPIHTHCLLPPPLTHSYRFNDFLLLVNFQSHACVDEIGDLSFFGKLNHFCTIVQKSAEIAALKPHTVDLFSITSQYTTPAS